MTAPEGHDQSSQTLRRANFSGATFIRSDFQDVTIRFSNASGLRMRETDVAGLEIDSHDLFFGSLFVNGVDVVPLVKAELNRQFPGRELLDATAPQDLMEGWRAVQDAWARTVQDTPEDVRDVQVDGEWSLAQTLRHLVLATDAWLRAGIQREPDPFHEIGQLFTGAAEMGFDVSRMREPRDFEEILTVRAERQQMVTDYLASATQEQLDRPASNPWDPDGDWTPTEGDCIRVVLEEEWAHLRYIRRDLATLS